MRSKLVKAKVALMLDQPWFGQLSCFIVLKPRKEVKTACINERGELFYNPDWIENLSFAEVKGTLAHEILHLAFGHLFRGKGKNPVIWNIAADLKVNETLVDSGFVLPEGCPRPNGLGEWNNLIKIRDKNTEIIYQELLDKLPKQVQEGLASGVSENLSEPWKTLVKKLVRDIKASEGKLKKAGLDWFKKRIIGSRNSKTSLV